MIRFAPNVVLISLALSLALGCRTEEAVPETGAPGTPVIVISVDTLRSDRLPMYGYEEIETPALDALRDDSILFERAYATVPLTLPSHASILSGQDPDEHGVRSNVGYRVGENHPSLPRTLNSHGYDTGAAVSAWVLRSETGMGEHFSFYEDQVGDATGVSFANVQRSGEKTAMIGADWIIGRVGMPFFFMLHLFEPHTPLTPPEDLSGQYEDPYDGEILATDRVVGKFLDRLRQAGVYDKALIIFLSDHGEGLGDHGEPGHGIFLYREAIQVPLLIKLPDSRRGGESVATPVSLIDVAPSILRFLGIDPPAAMAGVNLLAETVPARPIYSETLYPRLHLGWSELRSIVSGNDHYIESPNPELYDIVADPGETRNVLEERRREFAALRQILDDRPLALRDPSSVNPEEAAKLAALGYLGSSVSTEGDDLPDPKEKIGDLQKLIVAMDLASSGNSRRAIEVFQDLLHENPKLAEGWLQLGRLLDEVGRWEESLEAYQAAMRIAPESSGETALSIAEILLRLERLDEAREHVDLGRAINPARADLISARIALGAGEPDAAMEKARAVPEGVYRDEAQVLLATVLAQDGRLNEAMRILETIAQDRVSRGQPPPEGLLFVRGDVLARMDRLPEAIASFEKEIELYPNHLQTYANLAVVNVLRGERAEADALLDQMVRNNPSPRAERFAAHTRAELGLDGQR